MTQGWVPYGKGSAVQEAIAMAAALSAQGVAIKPMHQGYEETEPAGPLTPFRSFSGKVSGRYQPATGHIKVKETFSGFIHDFLGLPARPDLCFTLQANGRVGLGHAFALTANQYASADLERLCALVPSSRWPMVDAKASQARIQNLCDYDIDSSSDRIAANIIQATEDAQKRHQVAAIYTNFPHNPTGMTPPAEQIEKLQAYLNELNVKRAQRGIPPVVHIADDPYFMGLPMNEKAPYLRSPYAGNFSIGGPTPSIHIISFSKALACASPGFHGLMFTCEEMAARYKSFLTTDLGPSFVPELMDGIAAMLDPQQHRALREHFSKIGKKYRINNPIFEKHIPWAVQGDAAMCRVFRVPESALNKRILYAGQSIDIRTVRDVCAYIANIKGVILVAQAEKGQETLVRIALKSENPDMVEAGCKDIAAAVEELENAAPISDAA